MLGVLLDIILSNKLSYSKLSVTKAYFLFRPFGLFSVTGLGSRCVAVLSLESSLNQMAILVHHHALSRDQVSLLPLCIEFQPVGLRVPWSVALLVLTPPPMMTGRSKRLLHLLKNLGACQHRSKKEEFRLPPPSTLSSPLTLLSPVSAQCGHPPCPPRNARSVLPCPERAVP